MINRKMFFTLRIFLVTLILVLALGVTAAQDDTQILIAAAGTGDPHSIDPQQASDTRDWNLANNLFPGLTTFDEETREVVPGLTTGWDISTDGLVYTFHLIENVAWVRYNADISVRCANPGHHHPSYSAQYYRAAYCDRDTGNSGLYLL